jgi:hypothetical protein
VRILDRLQIGNEIPDFLAVEKRHAADQHVRHLRAAQFGLE